MAEATGLGLINFETGDMSQVTTVETEGSNTFVASATAKNNGSYGGLATYDGTSEKNRIHKTLSGGDASDLYMRAYIYFPSSFSWSSDGYRWFMGIKDADGGTPLTNILQFRFYFSGTDILLNRLEYYDSTGAHNVGLDGTTITRDTWHYVELHYKTGSGDGEVEIWLDGTSKGSATSLTTGSYVPDGGYVGGDAFAADNGAVIYYDDWKFDSSAIGAYSDISGLSIPVAANHYKYQGGM